MLALESLIEDPIIQFLIFIILFIGVMDAFKFLLMFIWKKLGGDK